MFKIRKTSKGIKNFECCIKTNKTMIFVYNAKMRDTNRGIKRKAYNPFIKKTAIHIYI